MATRFQVGDVLVLTKQHLEVTGWPPTRHNGTVTDVDGSRVFYETSLGEEDSFDLECPGGLFQQAVAAEKIGADTSRVAFCFPAVVPYTLRRAMVLSA